ncbi:MAG TPA: hypothetical protein VHZ52_04145 [Acidobacteriaceae bacterium]|jgi:hypothetical protein|nr:hypothetical protein [Acidobacteriaceae bacterium]
MEIERQLWKVCDKRRFLISTMEELAGDAHISFEGDLSAFALLNFADASEEETSVLKRNTLSPRQDFVVLPLETGLATGIIRAIGGTVPKTILHIQVEKAGRLEMGLYDQFHPEATFFGPALTAPMLDRLESEGILRKWNVLRRMPEERRQRV